MDLSFSTPHAAEEGAVATEPRALRLVGRPDGAAGRWDAVLAGAGFEVCQPQEWAEAESGLALVAVEDLSARELLDFVAARADQDGWVVGVLTEGSSDVRVVSCGPVTSAERLVGWAEDQADADIPLELRSLLKAFSIARHDLNNPLTSALAETQLALMDEPGGEIQEALETVQRQLRRMRDLLKELAPYRWR